MMIWLLSATALVASLLLTGLLRRYALARSVLDIPNERSSHTVPTPRGGGVAIVLSFLAAIAALALSGLLAWPVFWALFGGGGLVALIGFLDDHGHIAARWRLLAHFCGAGWALFWLKGLPALTLFERTFDLGWAGHVLAAVGLVWLLNLYNFMDGIDGIAGVEAVTVCIGGSLLYGLASPAGTEWHLPLALLAAVSGFLFWNFPPARIFMGDAGSGFLGLVLGLLALQAAAVSSTLFFGWIILLGVFIIDATVTLVRRIVRGERFYEAHRSHAYQYASRRHGAHKPVTVAVGLINLLWLLPLAAAVAAGYLDGLAGVMVAYLPLMLVAFRYKAGAGHLQDV
jgi:Fuc2NAc and GlcNAc transferase